MQHRRRISDGGEIPIVIERSSTRVKVFKLIIIAMIFLAVIVVVVYFTAFSTSQLREVWRDDFNGNKLDESKWYFGNIGCSGNGNNEKTL